MNGVHIVIQVFVVALFELRGLRKLFILVIRHVDRTYLRLLKGRTYEQLIATRQVLFGFFSELFGHIFPLEFPFKWLLRRSLLVLGIRHVSLFPSSIGRLGHLSFLLTTVGVIASRVENFALINLVVVKIAHIVTEMVLRGLPVGLNIFIFGLFCDYW